MARLPGPQLALPLALRRLLAGVDEFERANQPGGVGGRDRLSRRRRPLRERGVQRFRSALLERFGPARADRRIGRWAQIQLGERRPQVQPGAADDDRPALLPDRAVDLLVREL